jgi:hypothetical protein
MPLSLTTFLTPTGEAILDATRFVRSAKFSTNLHGTQAIDAELDRNMVDSFRIYDAPGMLHIEADDGAQTLAAARLEEPGLHAGGVGALKLHALGYWRALTDIPYTAMWSDTSLSRWRAVSNTELTNRTPERYDIRTENNQFELAPRKGETFGGNASAAPLPAVCSYLYQPPNGGSQRIQLVQLDFTLNAPTGWRMIVYRVGLNFSTFNSVFTVTSAGAAISRSIFTSITADDWIMVDLYLDTVGTAVAAFDTGTAYLRVSNVRFCSTFADIANTVLSANRNAGASVTATVTSTLNMYVGQRLTVNGGANPSESVLVEQVTNSTQFVATFVNNYVAGNPIGGSRVCADTIVKDLIAVVAAANPTQLSTSTSGVFSPGRDLVDAVYTDELPSDIMTALATQGTTANGLYEAGVDDQRRVFFRPQGSAAQTWFVDISDLDITRSADGLANSAYAVYTDASGIETRTAVSTNAASVIKYGITRRQAVDVQTTNSTYATGVRDTAIAAATTVQARARYTIRAVYGSNGARHPLGYVRAGDVMTIRNLPPQVSAAVDSIRTFRLSRTEYDMKTGILAIEPEAPNATLDALVGGQL